MSITIGIDVGGTKALALVMRSDGEVLDELKALN